MNTTTLLYTPAHIRELAALLSEVNDTIDIVSRESQGWDSPRKNAARDEIINAQATITKVISSIDITETITDETPNE